MNRFLFNVSWRKRCLLLIITSTCILFMTWFAVWNYQQDNHHQENILADPSSSSSHHHRQYHRDPLDRPNFIVLFVDDLGYGDLGYTGHPVIQTPIIDWLAWNGKIMTSWYSACAVCSCSRASLMTGRQWPRTGVKAVFGPTEPSGMSMTERTLAQQLKLANYSTAIVGKWHLGQRQVYLPANRGFDYYLGIPYSDDMGNAHYSTCPVVLHDENDTIGSFSTLSQTATTTTTTTTTTTDIPDDVSSSDYDQDQEDQAKFHIPLIYQERTKTDDYDDASETVHTDILEQPVDLTTLAARYNDFAINFIRDHAEKPFFLYVPFSHVHVTSGVDDATGERRDNTHYATCSHQGNSKRGAFGDAVAEVDWMIGNIMDTLTEQGLLENTLVLFTSDNGPWLATGVNGGSAGPFQGRFAQESSNYTNTAKGSTWEGGIREPAFAYWKGQIEPHSRSSETVSSMDVFPTLSSLAGVPLPTDRVYDGRSITHLLLKNSINDNAAATATTTTTTTAASPHDFLFFYGECNGSYPRYGVTAVRHGPYKAHFCTMPGVGSVKTEWIVHYSPYPLLFHIEHDPAEAFPLSTGEMPSDPEHAQAMQRIMRAYAMEKATFTYGSVDPEPVGPNEVPGQYGICCDRHRDCSCTLPPSNAGGRGLWSIGSDQHHDRYHDIIGEKNHAHT